MGLWHCVLMLCSEGMHCNATGACPPWKSEKWCGSEASNMIDQQASLLLRCLPGNDNLQDNHVNLSFDCPVSFMALLILLCGTHMALSRRHRHVEASHWDMIADQCCRHEAIITCAIRNQIRNDASLMVKHGRTAVQTLMRAWTRSRVSAFRTLTE